RKLIEIYQKNRRTRNHRSTIVIEFKSRLVASQRTFTAPRVYKPAAGRNLKTNRTTFRNTEIKGKTDKMGKYKMKQFKWRSVKSRRRITMVPDSGSTDHLVNDLSVVQAISPYEKIVNFGGTERIAGKVVRLVPNSLNISTAIFSTSFRFNLLSLYKLTLMRLYTCFWSMKIIDDKGMERAPIYRTSNMYQVGVYYDSEKQEVAAISQTSKMLQHQRNMHFFDTTCRIKNCHACQQNKGQKPSHNRRPQEKGITAKRFNEVVHIDIVGPISLRSFNNHRYRCNLVDGYTGWGESYPLKSKTEPYLALRQWAQSHGRPQAVRCDNGAEFQDLFAKECRRYNTTIRRSAPYEPEQNGLAERFNRTIVDAIRTVVADTDRRLWAAAARAVSFVRNRLARREKEAPYKMRFQRNAATNYFRRFGSLCYYKVHVRTKMEPKYRMGCFVGYGEQNSTYRVAHYSKDGALVVSECYAVKFDESKTIKNMNSIKNIDDLDPLDLPGEFTTLNFGNGE
ncbi:unnamed protein product, partial [Amoebophrya sp. A120]